MDQGAMNFDDNKPKVYLETSFFFYLTGRETDNVKVATEQEDFCNGRG